MTMTNDQRNTLIAVCDAITDTVNEAGPLGAPAGPMYLAFMQVGLSLESFQQITTMLVKVGKITKSGDVYYPATAQAPGWTAVET